MPRKKNLNCLLVPTRCRLAMGPDAPPQTPLSRRVPYPFAFHEPHELPAPSKRNQAALHAFSFHEFQEQKELHV